MPAPVDFEELIDRAEAVVGPLVRETPMEESPALSRQLGTPVSIKFESLQETGSFKVRGALFALSEAREEGASRVATCSAGNHGLGLAHAARHFGMPARIYVPGGVDQKKASLLEELGAEVIRSPFQGFDETETWALAEVDRDGIPFISAYDDIQILAGNGGTLMREMRRQQPDLETVVVPVGGGGLSGGMALSADGPIRLVAAQAAASPALALSLARGEAVTRLAAAETLAGGLEGGIGATGFDALRTRVNQVVEVSEPEIRAGVRWTLAEHRYLIEPSSAVAIAAALNSGVQVSGP
ncbi:MAG: pyridoxal-phosphate dependent enzyme, partial [Rhodothermales bacterium]|nr:pyridoxal-phosphate dependent enzyme [Rhodothermales bacterium]